MKHFLFLLFFFFLRNILFAAPEPSYTEKYLNSSVAYYQSRNAKNKILEQQGRYSEADYILDLSKEHHKIPLLSHEKHAQLNAELQYLNSLRNISSGKSYGRFMAVLYPAFPEGDVERKVTLDSIVTFINNFNSRLDDRDSLILFNINYLIANDASNTSLIPSLTSGSALSFWTSDYKNTIAEGNLLACAECNTLEGLLAKEFEVVRMQLEKESNALNYVSFESFSKHLSNGHLFFISTTSRLFAINIQELHSRYNGKNPLYAFWFKQCAGESYMFRLYAIRVKLNNNQNTIDNYYLDESFDVDNQFRCLEDPKNTKYIKAVYPEINAEKDIILYSDEAPSKYYFDRISNVKNYSSYYLKTLKGNSDCVFSVVIPPTSGNGSPTTSTNLPALNNKIKTVGCKLSKDEIVTLNAFIEKHAEINIIVTDEKTVDAYIKDIHPSATTIWINRTEVSTGIYEYEPQNDPGDYSNFWSRWKTIWNYNNLGESDKPDFKNCFRDVKRSLGYTLDHWHTAATFLSDQLDNLRIPEKYWNEGHPEYSKTDSYIRDVFKEIHKKNFISFTTVGSPAQSLDFFDVKVFSESDRFALFCGVVNGALDVLQSIPDAVVLITDLCRVDYTQLPRTIMEKGQQISLTLSQYKSENGEGAYYFIKDAIGMWVDKQNSNTICHHSARVLVNVLACYAAVIKGTSVAGKVGGSIIKVLSTLDKIADAISPIGWTIKYCKWIYKSGEATLSVVYEYGGKVWMKMEGGIAYIKAKSPIMTSVDLVQIPSDNLRLYSKANAAFPIDKNISDINPNDIIWVKDPVDGQWKKVQGEKPDGSADPFEEAPLSLADANKKFLTNISKDYPLLAETLQKQNWNDETLGKFISDFGGSNPKLYFLNQVNDVDKILSKWQATGENDIGKIRASLINNSRLITNFTERIRETYYVTISNSLIPEQKGSSILLKNLKNETVAIITNNKLTPTKWKAAYKSSSAPIKTSEGYWLLKEGDEFYFDLGFREGRRLRAEEVNDYLVNSGRAQKEGQPYTAGTYVIERYMEPGEPIHFVEDYNNKIPSPGGFASKAPISTVYDLRFKLAVLEEWKRLIDDPTLRSYIVKQRLMVRSGEIGRQLEKSGTYSGVTYPGGGHQYEIIGSIKNDWESWLNIENREGIKLIK